MVLTEDTFNEQSSFFNLFKDIVDDVSVKQYTERGGELEYLKKDLIEQNKIDKKLNNSDLLRDPNGDLFISTGRLLANNLIKECLLPMMEELACVVK